VKCEVTLHVNSSEFPVRTWQVGKTDLGRNRHGLTGAVEPCASHFGGLLLTPVADLEK
jgi:hypothetical protein